MKEAKEEGREKKLNSRRIGITGPSTLAQSATLLTRIRKVSCSNLGRDTDCPDRDILPISSVTPGKHRGSSSIRPRPLPSTSFLIHSSLSVMDLCQLVTQNFSNYSILFRWIDTITWWRSTRIETCSDNKNHVSIHLYVGVEVFTAVALKSIIVWDMTPCSL
jgi:hypothetical protein